MARTQKDGSYKIKGMEGPYLLKEYEQEKGFTHADVAGILGVSHLTVACWARSEQRPSPQFQHVLYYLANIKPDAWLNAEERRFIKRMNQEILNLRKCRPKPEPTLRD